MKHKMIQVSILKIGTKNPNSPLNTRNPPHSLLAPLTFKNFQTLLVFLAFKKTALTPFQKGEETMLLLIVCYGFM